MGALARHFDLGFASDRPSRSGVVATDAPGGPDVSVRLPLGGNSRARAASWAFAAWLSLGCGIFLRQGLQLDSMSWQLQKLNYGAVAASLVIALAVFPPAMRWLNSKRRRPGVELLLAAFSVGFLLNLAALASLQAPGWLKLGQ